MNTSRTLATFASAVSLSLLSITSGYCEKPLNADVIISKAQIEAWTEYYKDTFLMRQTMLRTIRTADSNSADALKEAESTLEAISKSIEENADRRKLHKTKKIGGMELPSHEESSLVLYPGEEALDDPTAPIAAQFAKVLGFTVGAPIGAMRGNQIDTFLC